MGCDSIVSHCLCQHKSPSEIAIEGSSSLGVFMFRRAFFRGLALLFLFIHSATTTLASGTRGDFNGDGKADILWRNASSGAVYMMPMNGATVLPGTVFYTEPNPIWQIVATTDFDGDGKTDILWWNSSLGLVYQMLMNGTTIKSQGMIYQEADTNWRIVGTGDFNGDGKSDILWRNASTGAVYMMPMNGATVLPGTVFYTEPNQTWQIVSVADFDGDGKADILWWNSSSGLVYQMLMNGAAIRSQGMIYQEANTDWRIQPSKVTAAPAPVSVAILISPASSSLLPGQQQVFTATVSGTTNTAVKWSCTGGTVTTNGIYTAPLVAGTYTVTATSAQDISKLASTSVTVSGRLTGQKPSCL